MTGCRCGGRPSAGSGRTRPWPGRGTRPEFPMREGTCPAREAPPLEKYPRHRVILPVYIPNMEGYFARSLDALRLSLESLRITAAGKAAVTVVANDCAPEVLRELEG